MKTPYHTCHCQSALREQLHMTVVEFAKIFHCQWSSTYLSGIVDFFDLTSLMTLKCISFVAVWHDTSARRLERSKSVNSCASCEHTSKALAAWLVIVWSRQAATSLPRLVWLTEQSELCVVNYKTHIYYYLQNIFYNWCKYQLMHVWCMISQ